CALGFSLNPLNYFFYLPGYRGVGALLKQQIFTITQKTGAGLILFAHTTGFELLIKNRPSRPTN
ncbi:hypothetical protein ACVGWK_01820, partial [Enterobacter sichuanensis]